MANERDLAEAATLRRRRLVLAFCRGSDRESLLDTPRPNRAVAAGVGVALLCGIGAGISGVVRGGPPQGWDRDGTVVAVEETGRRYLTVDGTLRPVLNDTSLRLAGATREPVRVSERELGGHAVGPLVGDAGYPYAVPRLMGERRWLTCVRQGRFAVVLGTPEPTGSQAVAALLARDGTRSWLVTGGRRHEISQRAVDALGYDSRTALPVPAGWRDTVPVGPPMDRLLDRAPPPPRYVERGTGAEFVEVGGVLREVANHTALRLVYGRSVPPPAPISLTRLRNMPRGNPLGDRRWPDSPPALARVGPDTWACVSADTAAVRLLRTLAGSGVRPAAEAAPGGAEVWQPAQVGVLVGTTEQAREPSEDVPALLVADGRAFPITSPDVLDALGYDPDQLLVVPATWVWLLPAGPDLRRIRT